MTRPKFLVVFSAIAFLLAATLLAPATRAGEYSHARVVRLSLIEGDVQVSAADQPGWQKAVVNLPVREGMTLATGQGRAEVEFENGTTARIADNSVLNFVELALADGSKVTRLTLTQGTATLYAIRGHHDTLEVQAGKLQIATRDNSRFRIDVFQDGSSVSVLKGNVDVTAAGRTERLNKNQTLALRNDAPDQLAREHNPAGDTWDRWVSGREEALNVGRADSMRYVSPQVSDGLSDLSYYGSWYSYGSLGNCWRPYGVSMGWSPFYNGGWSFMPGFGLTWVSTEPWGWMPYHYGSWAFSGTQGWLWVPGQFGSWNPGGVRWYRGPGVVGWVPNSPNDRSGAPPQNLTHGVISNTAAGLASGLPNRRGALSSVAAAQLVTDPRTDEAMLRTVQQVKAAQMSRLTTAGARGGASAPAPSVASSSVAVTNTVDQNPTALAEVPVPQTIAAPRPMAARANTTTPAHVFIMPPASATAHQNRSSNGGNSSPSYSPSTPSARPSSPSPASHPAPAQRSTPHP